MIFSWYIAVQDLSFCSLNTNNKGSHFQTIKGLRQVPPKQPPLEMIPFDVKAFKAKGLRLIGFSGVLRDARRKWKRLLGTVEHVVDQRAIDVGASRADRIEAD